jgi:hypothetical protein
MAQEWVDEEADQKLKKKKKSRNDFVVSDEDSDAVGTVYRKKVKSKKSMYFPSFYICRL